jgi:RNA-directed DNA polymerase
VQATINYSANADIWSFRFDWAKNKRQLLRAVNHGDYVFSPLKLLTKQDGKVIHLWSSSDALVMKVLVGCLAPSFEIPMSCTHIRGHGGLKQTVAKVQRQLKNYQYVCKTDVKSFYESIDHYVLFEQIYDHIEHKTLRRYLWQIVLRTVEYGGSYREITRGISRGCPVSPLLGALYLKVLDKLFDPKKTFYVCYMDDILILSKTRWQNRRVIKRLNHCFNQLKVQPHPDKTFIGRIERGFDFLGYHFSREPLGLANITVRKHVQRLYRLLSNRKSKKPPQVRWL